MKPLPDRFRDENLFFSSKIRPKNGWKIDFSPPNIKNQPLTTLWIDRSWNFASIGGMDTSVRPNLTDLVAKTCNKSVKMKVSNGLRQLPRVYRVFPMVSKDPRGSSKVSEGSQTVSPTLHASQENSLRWCPKVPRLCPLRCIHVKKKVTTAWREKIDDWGVLTIDWS